MQLQALVLLLPVLFLVAACGQDASDGYRTSWATEASFDEDAAIEEAINEYSYSTYEDVFGYYQCTSDCEGHNAGFEWAKENGFLDSYQCDGSSESFVEGCQAYGEAISEYVETAREDHQ